jgi:hypothetical protein
MPRLVNSRSATLSWARRGKSTRSLGHHAPDAPNPLIVWAGAELTSTVGARAAGPGDARTPRRATAWADDGPAGRTTAPTTAPTASSRWQRALPRPTPRPISTAHSTPGTSPEWRLRNQRLGGWRISSRGRDHRRACRRRQADRQRALQVQGGAHRRGAAVGRGPVVRRARRRTRASSPAAGPLRNYPAAVCSASASSKAAARLSRSSRASRSPAKPKKTRPS